MICQKHGRNPCSRTEVSWVLGGGADELCQLMKSQKKSVLISIAKMRKVIFEKFKDNF